MITVFLAIAAAAAIFWPSRPGLAQLRFPMEKPAAPAHACYADAIQALSLVRGRLLATESLTDKERAAVDALTLALVNGSDRP